MSSVELFALARKSSFLKRSTLFQTPSPAIAILSDADNAHNTASLQVIRHDVRHLDTCMSKARGSSFRFGNLHLGSLPCPYRFFLPAPASLRRTKTARRAFEDSAHRRIDWLFPNRPSEDRASVSLPLHESLESVCALSSTRRQEDLLRSSLRFHLKSEMQAIWENDATVRHSLLERWRATGTPEPGCWVLGCLGCAARDVAGALHGRFGSPRTHGSPATCVRKAPLEPLMHDDDPRPSPVRNSM